MLKPTAYYSLLLCAIPLTLTASAHADASPAAPPRIVNITLDKCTHLVGGAEGPAQLTIVTDPPGAELHFSGQGHFTANTAGGSWLPAADTPPGKQQLTFSAVNAAGDSAPATVSVYLTRQPILTKLGNGGRFIDFTGAPSIKQSTLPYRPLSYYANREHVVMYELWSTWVPWCKAELPAIADLSARLGPAGFMYVGSEAAFEPRAPGQPDARPSDGEERERLKQIEDYYRDNGHPELESFIGDDPAWPSYFPSAKADVVPASILIDRDGNIRLQTLGALNGAELKLWADTIEELTGASTAADKT